MRSAPTTDTLVPFLGPVIALVVTLAGAATESSASPDDLRQALERFGSSREAETLEVSLCFSAANRTDSVSVVRWHADQLLVPASVTKIVTAVAALETLGPRHTLRTKILSSHPIGPDGVLEGDLIVKGGGDPFLVSERLWLLANQLRQSGLRQVQGGLVIDASRFAPDDGSASRILGNSHRAYAATPSAFAINFNALAVHILPADTPGQPPTVRADPIPFDYLEIDNRLTTGQPGRMKRGSVEITSAPPTHNGALERLLVAGSVPAGGKGFVRYRRAEDPLAFSASLFRAFLDHAGIGITGQTRFETAPESATPIFEFESEAVERLLSRMNRHSSNFIANQLAMSVAAARSDSASPVTLLDGGAALTQWMTETLPACQGLHLDEGSGLSTGNRISAEALQRLLTYAWNRLDLLPSLISSLPEPGEDGTLERRFQGPGRPVIHAKTGTLAGSGVSCLAGFVEDPHRGPVAFAILLNARSSKTWTLDQMQQLQERWILTYLR